MKAKISESAGKGYFFTIGIIILIIPLILLISHYVSMERTEREDLVGKIRCDELHYFVEDVEEDLRRAMIIFGRRAAIYTIDEVVTSGVPLAEYEFNCTGLCSVDCGVFEFAENASEAAIAELTLCGTLNGENVSYMMNNTLSEWLRRIELAGALMNFEVNMTILNLTVVPYDAWNFAVILNSWIDIKDRTGMCYYRGGAMRIESITSIIGLEDVLYPLNTDAKVIKYINNCTTELDLETVAGCSLTYGGEGTGTGNVIFYSVLEDETTKEERKNYCSLFEEYVDGKILVSDRAFGSICERIEQCCFNESCPHHFAGVINYGADNPSSWDKCSLTIPWITHTCKMDNETTEGPGWGCERPEGCNESYIGTDVCIMIRNRGECDPPEYDVIMGVPADTINTTCYSVSNVSENCSGSEILNGPSFFDRLDGNYNLSCRYVEQSEAHFNNSQIGIETLTNPFEIDDYGISVKEGVTWADYLYWQDIEGCEAVGACSAGPYSLVLDDLHADKYGIDTNCVNVTECVPASTTSTTTTTITTTTSTSTTTTVIAECAGFFDDMETDGGWVHGGDKDEWERGADCDAYSGASCWGTDLKQKYENDADEWLVSPYVDLTFATSATLTFYTQYWLEENNDFAYVELLNASGGWEILGTYTGDQTGWQEQTMDLSDYLGNTTRVRFRLTSDYGIRREGLYIDDVNISCS